ncbi:acyltransferase family protein [Sphingomonas citri]|jgi:peptidoglycan/LPS O-acetylase OafA/YrhL
MTSIAGASVAGASAGSEVERDDGALPRGGRDRAIDGWRAIAALFVVVAHAATFRFGAAEGALAHVAQRLATPLAQTGVQIFFVISGYIITALMMRERQASGRVDLAAFYTRRSCRILPPLLVYYASLVMLDASGALSLPLTSLVSSVSFSCNTGIVDCHWWVAHTWSLAVEEQFYLAWPMIFVLVAPLLRVRLLALGVIACGIAVAVRPGVFHSNATSFGCIAAGALYASSAGLRRTIQRARATVPWLGAVALLAVAPLTRLDAAVAVFLPPLVTYVVFCGNALPWVRTILAAPPLQLVGAASYSLYLWQQLFLAQPRHYAADAPSLLLLPLAVLASVWLVERPSIALGRRLSHRDAVAVPV